MATLVMEFQPREHKTSKWLASQSKYNRECLSPISKVYFLYFGPYGQLRAVREKTSSMNY